MTDKIKIYQKHIDSSGLCWVFTTRYLCKCGEFLAAWNRVGKQVRREELILNNLLYQDRQSVDKNNITMIA